MTFKNDGNGKIEVENLSVVFLKNSKGKSFHVLDFLIRSKSLLRIKEISENIESQ